VTAATRTRNASLAGVDLTDGGVLLAEDVAEWLGVAVSTVHEWARRGRLPSFKPPGARRLFFRVREIDAWLAGATMETKQLADGGRITRCVKPGGAR
jgi:excisionase family DNA binding protein